MAWEAISGYASVLGEQANIQKYVVRGVICSPSQRYHLSIRPIRSIVINSRRRLRFLFGADLRACTPRSTILCRTTSIWELTINRSARATTAPAKLFLLTIANVIAFYAAGARPVNAGAFPIL